MLGVIDREMKKGNFRRLAENVWRLGDWVVVFEGGGLKAFKGYELYAVYDCKKDRVGKDASKGLEDDDDLALGIECIFLPALAMDGEYYGGDDDDGEISETSAESDDGRGEEAKGERPEVLSVFRGGEVLSDGETVVYESEVPFTD